MGEQENLARVHSPVLQDVNARSPLSTQIVRVTDAADEPQVLDYVDDLIARHDAEWR